MDSRQIPTIILCGGKGMRLIEETEFKPKPMVKIGTKPILWHIMKIYKHYGCKEFLLALGYKGSQISDHFRSDSVFPANTGLNTPHGERVLRLKNHIDGEFMVTYGDGLADIDINKLVNYHKKMGKIATITGVHATSRWGLVEEKNGIVTGFNQKPLLSEYVNGGFMVFKNEFFDYLKKGDMIETALERLIPKKELALYKHDGFWYGMDTYKDFLYLNKLWKENPKWKVW